MSVTPTALHRVPRVLLVFLVFLLGLLLAAACSPTAPDEFGQPVPGQAVYDRAGVLTDEQTRALERQAASVQQAGAPVVVYLRSHESDDDDTEDDARALMDAWSVQSAPDAGDGIVVFLNLEPDDPRHGSAVVYAGRAHTDGGALPSYELERIFEDVMQPALARGELAAGLEAGLAELTASLQAGPKPAQEPWRATFATLVRLPFNLVALLLAGGALWWTLRTWRAQPRASTGPVVPITVPPGDLPPGYVGALVAGQVANNHLEATLLDLARRGALVLEPADSKHLQLRLLRPDLVRDPVEEAVWSTLTERADANGVVPHKEVERLSEQWTTARKALERELAARGWFDPRVEKRRPPLYVVGAALLVLAIVSLVAAAIAEELWGLLGAGCLAVAALTALIVGGALRATTLEGEHAAQPWRGYKAGLRQAKHTPTALYDLDEALPYAVALGATSTLNRHLKAASAQGYAPAWFARSHAAADSAGFYPYWAALHTSLGSSSSASSGGVSASSGGAGAGGSF